ncbi:Copper chaperone domain-containing protein [Dioscorea alata]|uniref:Copper chaperone domain-containing protein n=1 Tax=Dioscorea alata TaxID=55571 RepID=A0ACB7WMH0_DIOAL|nr:Copper chaperone domain-containing protein [Dioscorea alata]
MKQKIVIKVQMNCEKCRIKAMKIVAATEGVESVGVEGKDNDQLVVIGDGVDSIRLTSKLRKKVGHAVLVNVNEEKKPGEKTAEKAKPQTSAVVYLQINQMLTLIRRSCTLPARLHRSSSMKESTTVNVNRMPILAQSCNAVIQEFRWLNKYHLM